MKNVGAPATNALYLQEPDSPGTWRFTGTIRSPRDPASGIYDVEMHVDQWLFKVVQQGESLVTLDPANDVELDAEWRGKWVRE